MPVSTAANAKIWTLFLAASWLPVIHCVENDLFGPRDIRMTNLLSTARGFGKRAPDGLMYHHYRLSNIRSPLDLVGGLHKRAEMSDFLSTARGFGKRKMSTLLSTARGFGKRSSRDTMGKRKMSTLLSTARGFGKRSAEVAVPRPSVPDNPDRADVVHLQHLEQLTPDEVDNFFEVVSNLQGDVAKRSDMSSMFGTARGFGKRKMSGLLSTARGFGKRSSLETAGLPYFNVLDTLQSLKRIEELTPEEVEDFMAKLRLGSRESYFDDASSTNEDLQHTLEDQG